MNARLGIVVFLLAGVPTMAHAVQDVSFASNQATVPLPNSFKVQKSADGLKATFGKDGDHTVEITLLAALSKPGGGKGLALEFIKAQADKRGAKVSTDGERAVFSEAGEKHSDAGKVFQAMHWQIGVGNCVFTMTLTAPLPMSQELDEFLGDPLNTIVNRLSCAASATKK